MPFTRPTLKDIDTRIQGDVGSRVTSKPLLRRAFVKALSRGTAGTAHLQHFHLEYLAKQLLPDQAEGDYLVRWAAIYGLQPNPAEYATGLITATGENDSSIEIDTIVQTQGGVQYQVTAKATIEDGEAIVSVIAVKAGLASNLGAGEELNFLSPVAGVDSVLTVGEDGIAGGEDVEGEDSLRARLLERIQEPPHGGNHKDYVLWALEVPGVTRAWVYPLHLGLGTVGVTFVLDDHPTNIIPDVNKVAEVQTYIDELRPVTADVTVFAPTTKALDMTLEITPDTAAIRAAVVAEIEDLIRRESAPGGAFGVDGTILLSRINEAISLASGEEDHALTLPATDVTVDTGEIVIPGVITWVT